MTWRELPYINIVPANREIFGQEVINIAARLAVHPFWLMAVMYNETAKTMRHDIKNPTSTATGLIQFMEATAIDLGTTTAKLRAMSNVEQLRYVEKYLSRYKSKINDLGDAYLAVFYPAALYKDRDFVFPQWVVNANPIFDIDKDKKLTKAEFKEYVKKYYGALDLPLKKKV